MVVCKGSLIRTLQGGGRVGQILARGREELALRAHTFWPLKNEEEEKMVNLVESAGKLPICCRQ